MQLVAYSPVFQHPRLITILELGSRETLIRCFHLRFNLAAEWAPFAHTALQLATEVTNHHAEIDRALGVVAASMYDGQPNENGERA